MTCAGLERSPALVGQILELGALRGGGIALVEASLIILVRWIFTTIMNNFYGYNEENTLENLYGCNEENIQEENKGVMQVKEVRGVRGERNYLRLVTSCF